MTTDTSQPAAEPVPPYRNPFPLSTAARKRNAKIAHLMIMGGCMIVGAGAGIYAQIQEQAEGQLADAWHGGAMAGYHEAANGQAPAP